MIWLWIILGIVGFCLISLIGMYAATMPVAKRIYLDMLVRTSPDKWARGNSCPEDAEHSRMYGAGLAWGEANAQYMKEASAENDGLRLRGEYYDFGSDRAVLILPGRAETLKYSYYFAEPYQAAGYNVLVADPRAHGLSEGTHSTVGVKESGDANAWIRLLNTELGVKEVVMHGVCIGGCAAILAATAPAAPACIAGIIAEGPFTTFYDIFSQRTRNGGHPSFPLVLQIRGLMKRATGADMLRDAAPVKAVSSLDIPILLMYSRQDAAVPPRKAKKVIAACASPGKRVVWFDTGSHSHIRINNTAKYDSTIASFLRSGC